MRPIWIDVLRRIYPEVARRYNAVVGGSQIFYVNLGLALPSKDIDLFVEEFNPLELSRRLAEALGLAEERFEALGKATTSCSTSSSL
ncbi:MAG: hypothetical protein ACP5KY_07805 [Thermoproteus sp.]